MYKHWALEEDRSRLCTKQQAPVACLITCDQVGSLLLSLNTRQNTIAGIQSIYSPIHSNLLEGLANKKEMILFLIFENKNEYHSNVGHPFKQVQLVFSFYLSINRSSFNQTKCHHHVDALLWTNTKTLSSVRVFLFDQNTWYVHQFKQVHTQISLNSFIVLTAIHFGLFHHATKKDRQAKFD